MICVLTHDPKFDVPVLEIALRTPVGVRRRHGFAAARMRTGWLGCAPGRPDRGGTRPAASPIGLDLGARTPEETAISIAAEIIAAALGRHRPGPHQHGRPHPPRRARPRLRRRDGAASTATSASTPETEGRGRIHRDECVHPETEAASTATSAASTPERRRLRGDPRTPDARGRAPHRENRDRITRADPSDLGADDSIWVRKPPGGSGLHVPAPPIPRDDGPADAVSPERASPGRAPGCRP